jgi:GMP reductase
MRFDYDDINLVPRYSTVDSRSQCDTSIKFGKHTFKNCVIPANMESVINEELAIKLAENGYFYVMHRFDVDNIKFTKMMKNKGLIASISVGVNQDSYDYVDEVLNNSISDEDIIPDYITIDIAHGHCRKMKKMIKYLKEKLPSVFLIAGNVSTIDATRDLDNWGADAIKVGIGPGSACTTYPTTGFGSRNIQASVVHECSLVTKKYVVADGGIKSPADISKSVVLGASMCMVGGMLSSFMDSPGRTVEQDGRKYKEFYGSASANQSNKSKRIEGTVKLNPMKNHTMLDYMDYLSECLESAISYGGGTKLEDLQSVKWF